MRTVAVANEKGGTAKTTSAVCLAGALGERGRRVLVLDLDAQGAATSWLGGAPGGLLDVLRGEAEIGEELQETTAEGVDLIAADPRLVGFDRAMAAEVGAETLLRDALAGLPARRWDWLLIDCPPQFGLGVVSALTAAREVLIPVEASVGALQGLADLYRNLRRVRSRLNDRLSALGVLVCRLDRRTRLAGEVLERLAASETFGPLVLEAKVRSTVRVAEAQGHRQPITAYDPRSGAAEDYRAAAAEIEGRRSTRLPKGS